MPNKVKLQLWFCLFKNPFCLFQTSLVNTILDNPNKLLKQDIISHILTYLDNDTLLCREEVLFIIQYSNYTPYHEIRIFRRSCFIIYTQYQVQQIFLI